MCAQWYHALLARTAESTMRGMLQAQCMSVLPWSRPPLPRTVRGLSDRRLAIRRRLPKVFLDFEFDGRQTSNAEVSHRSTQTRGEVLCEHFNGGVGNVEERTILGRKDVFLVTFVRHGHRAVAALDVELRVGQRQKDFVIDLVAEPTHHALELRKIDDVPAFFIERSLQRYRN